MPKLQTKPKPTPKLRIQVRYDKKYDTIEAYWWEQDNRNRVSLVCFDGCHNEAAWDYRGGVPATPEQVKIMIRMLTHAGYTPDEYKIVKRIKFPKS